MIDILSARSVVSLHELADYFEVDNRTIQRMRDDLIELGYEIKTHRGPHGGIELVKSRPFNIADYSDEDIRAINMGLDRLLTFSEFHHNPSIMKLKHEFSQLSRFRIIEGVERRALNIDLDQYYGLISKLQSAIESHRKIEVTYQSSYLKPIKKYIVEPYELFVVDRMLYLGALNEDYESRSFKVSRMHDLMLLDQKFSKDESLYSAKIKEGSGFKINPLTVKVRVRDFDFYREFIWGQDQVITDIDDRTYELVVTFGSLWYAQEFVLIGKKHVEILEPESLKNWLIEEVQSILKVYGEVS